MSLAFHPGRDHRRCVRLPHRDILTPAAVACRAALLVERIKAPAVRSCMIKQSDDFRRALVCNALEQRVLREFSESALPSFRIDEAQHFLPLCLYIFAALLHNRHALCVNCAVSVHPGSALIHTAVVRRDRIGQKIARLIKVIALRNSVSVAVNPHPAVDRVLAAIHLIPPSAVGLLPGRCPCCQRHCHRNDERRKHPYHFLHVSLLVVRYDFELKL